MITKPDFQNAIIDQVRSEFLFESDFYQLKNWTFDFSKAGKPSEGYNDCFCIVFMKRGNYLFDVAKNNYQIYTGCIILEKPDFEYRIRPASGEFFVYNFNERFYAQVIEELSLKHAYFFSNQNILTQIISSTPEIEHLHHYIFTRIPKAGKLEMDGLVFELFNLIISVFTTNSATDELKGLSKINHLSTIEKAKEYINQNFHKDISLQEIAGYSCVSPFHFSRIFRRMTSYSPYKYLLQVRLKHGELLLKNSLIPISEISVVCGFSSAEHFATAFKYKYKMPPSAYRKELRGIR